MLLEQSRKSTDVIIKPLVGVNTKERNKTKVVINILVSDNGQIKFSSNIETNKMIYIKGINHGRVNNIFKSNLIVHKRVAQKMTQMHKAFFFRSQLHSMTTNRIQRMRTK